MADFVPFLKAGGFRAHVFADQLEVVRQAQHVEPVRGPAPGPERSLPDHGRGEGHGLDRSMPEPPPPAEVAPVGPTEDELLEMLREAHSRGRAEAEAEAAQAFAQLKAEAEAELAKYAGVAEALDAHKAALQAEVRDQVGKLLVQALRRLTARTPELLDRILEARCGEVAEHMVGAAEVVVRVHPDDVELTRRFLGERQGWRVTGDRDIRGGCVAESAAGRMDASLDAGLDALQEAVKAWREEARARRDDA